MQRSPIHAENGRQEILSLTSPRVILKARARDYYKIKSDFKGARLWVVRLEKFRLGLSGLSLAF